MRPKLSEDVVPLTEFLNRASQMLVKLRKTRRPLILTRRGHSAAVIEDIKTYENKMELLELLRSIVKGIEAAEQRGRISHPDAMKRLDTLADE
jgi:PHD/YefM family antitoxin component YafN of YafNO toxin-antitoxin module